LVDLHIQIEIESIWFLILFFFGHPPLASNLLAEETMEASSVFVSLGLGIT